MIRIPKKFLWGIVFVWIVILLFILLVCGVLLIVAAFTMSKYWLLLVVLFVDVPTIVATFGLGNKAIDRTFVE